MEVFPIPPLSRGRPVLSEVEGSGGGWGIYVAVVLMTIFAIMNVGVVFITAAL